MVKIDIDFKCGVWFLFLMLIMVFVECDLFGVVIL